MQSKGCRINKSPYYYCTSTTPIPGVKKTRRNLSYKTSRVVTGKNLPHGTTTAVLQTRG